MSVNKREIKIGLLFLLVGAILCLHYFMSYSLKNHHTVYRMLFYFPLVLGSFWFGLKGSILIALSVSIFYLPYLFLNWQGFSFEDFDKLLEEALYIVIALMLGGLVERKRKEHAAYLRSERLSAVGSAVAEIAHDMKTPLMAIGGFTNQIFRKLEDDDLNRKKLKVVMEETARLESMISEMLLFSRTIKLQLQEVIL